MVSRKKRHYFHFFFGFVFSLSPLLIPYYNIFGEEKKITLVTHWYHWGNPANHEEQNLTVKTSMISSTYATYTGGKVPTAVTYTYTYRHVSQLFFLFLKFFLFFFTFFICTHAPTTTPLPPHVAECKSHTTCRELCAARYTRYTQPNFPDLKMGV